MPTSQMFRVNYFVGALLAQGGNLWMEGTKIVFSPTSALDRAMGAKNVEINFDQILSINYSGALSRTFNIKTSEKTHKFEGGQIKQFWELLEKGLPNKVVNAAANPGNTSAPVSSAPKTSGSLTCDRCSKSIQPGYQFCPYCTLRLKSTCSSCHRATDPSWAACAFCGWKF